MRRLFVPSLLVPMLLLALAAPAAAAPPMKESGTQTSLYSSAFECSGSTCTDTTVDAWMIDNETLVVCLSRTTFNARTGQTRSFESGCTETSPSALTISGSFDVTLAETTISFEECNRRGCRITDTVTVSANDSAVSPIFSHSDRGTFSDGTCTYRYSSTGQSAEVAGTMTIDGVVYDQWGYASIATYSTTARCR